MNIFLSHNVDAVRQALDLDCGWVHCDSVEQLDELIPLCREADVILTLQGDVQKVMDTRVHGVILSPDDMAAAEAREFLGPHAIIGVEAADAEAIIAQAALDVDFFVLTVPDDAAGAIVQTVREKGVQQRILSRSDSEEVLSVGIDGLITSNLNLF